MKFTLVLIDAQKLRNFWLSNGLPLSTVISDGTANLQMIFCQNNF